MTVVIHDEVSIFKEHSCFLEPPSEVRNLEVVSSTDTTITLRWTRPLTTGRSDFFYGVSYSDPNNIGEFISSEDNLVTNSGTSHWASSLHIIHTTGVYSQWSQ